MPGATKSMSTVYRGTLNRGQGRLPWYCCPKRKSAPRPLNWIDVRFAVPSAAAAASSVVFASSGPATRAPCNNAAISPSARSGLFIVGGLVANLTRFALLVAARIDPVRRALAFVAGVFPELVVRHPLH